MKSAKYLLVLVLVLSLGLVGCGENATTAVDSDAPAAVTDAAVEAVTDAAVEAVTDAAITEASVLVDAEVIAE